MTEDTLTRQIAAKKAELDRLRPQAPHGLENLNQSYDIELTYTSNAIEGNTLTAAETRMVIEHGDYNWRQTAERSSRSDRSLRSAALCPRSHAAGGAVEGSRYPQSAPARHAALKPRMAGRYANQGRFVETDSGRHHFPSPAEVPALMGDFAQWLAVPPQRRKLHLRRTAALSKSTRSMTATAVRRVF